MALFIAGVNFIAVAFQWLPELTSQSFDGRRTFRMFFPIIAVVVLLQDRASLLAGLLQAFRSVGVYIVNLPMRLQILNMSLAEALSNFSAQTALLTWLTNAVQGCDPKLGSRYEACLRDGMAWV